MAYKKKNKPGPKPNKEYYENKWGEKPKKKPGPKPGSIKKNKSSSPPPVLFTLEKGIPIPARNGKIDPHFQEIYNVMTSMRRGQSFVVPVASAKTPAAINVRFKMKFVLRKQVIKPDEEYVRFWRVK